MKLDFARKSQGKFEGALITIYGERAKIIETVERVARDNEGCLTTMVESDDNKSVFEVVLDWQSDNILEEFADALRVELGIAN